MKSGKSQGVIQHRSKIFFSKVLSDCYCSYNNRKDKLEVKIKKHRNIERSISFQLYLKPTFGPLHTENTN